MAKKILIIEDENDIRSVYVELLQAAGYEVEEAADGDTGMEKAKNMQWDLLLLDIILPKRDGLEILEALKATLDSAKRPVILLTNLEGTDIVRKSMKLGVSAHIVKSNVDPQYVLDSIEKYL